MSAVDLDKIPDDVPFELPDDLEDLWSDFRRSLVRRGRAPDTIALYRRKYDLFWTWAITTGVAAAPGEVSAKVVNAFFDHVMATPVIRNDRPVMTTSPLTGEVVPKMPESSTLRITWRNLRPFWSWWAREFDETNPFDRADRPGEDRPAPIPVVPLDDVRRLLGTCSGRTFVDRRDAAIIRVLLDVGARLGELTNLRVEDWDRRRDLLTLTGKTGTRIVPIAASTGEALARYLRDRKAHRHAALPALWLAPRGVFGQSGLAAMLRRRCDEAGVDHVNPHRFRHTWAHEFRARGGSEGDLVVLAGWTSSAMAQRYGNSAAAERAQAAARTIALGDAL